MNQNNLRELPGQTGLLPTVKELQAKRTATLGNILTEIGNNIRREEDRGCRVYTWWPKANAPIALVIEALNQAGYKATEKNDFDPRDGNSKIVKIEWS